MAFALLIFHLFREGTPHPPHPPSLQGIITINQDACFFITSYNGHCMFGTYWLAIGTTYTFSSHIAAYLALFNICLSQAEWNMRWYLELKWAGLPASDSETLGQQSNLIVSWQQHYPMWLKLLSWCECAGCGARRVFPPCTLGFWPPLFPLYPLCDAWL